PPSNIAPKQGLIAPNCLEVVYVWPYIVHSRHITKAHVLIVSKPTGRKRRNRSSILGIVFYHYSHTHCLFSFFGFLRNV
ncbi:unnamed protein product, partial [Porites evermanni]